MKKKYASHFGSRCGEKKKTFDQTETSMIRKTLGKCGIEDTFFTLTKRTYEEHTHAIMANAEMFDAFR